MKPTYPVVCVHWTDASHHDGEIALEDLRPLIELATVGFLVRQDRRSVSVAMEVGADGRMRDVSHIPRVLIQRVEKLRGRKQ